ncbi:hypothetical protein [Deinococcus peraridilitoris]|uniref:Uncharacterized protein n=1 Tax=Deinococcus peraridilitoris (strain DSM 19664 / LMG 22246 / CIP 109416 / KR-200) TaxID=937777 RepID=L0A5C9_DEIPD|nr:hypothetical protein [Deinococcus peraridilitoris]AFZ68624.1 hypothetical protein Deipe_3181 [Deinococcus peraridilitoris DSM 19664]
MEFIVLRAGQVIHEEPMLPGAVPALVGLPAVEGVGVNEHLGENRVEGWKIELNSLEELLRLSLDVQGQVVLRRPSDLRLNGQEAFALDITPGIGQ